MLKREDYKRKCGDGLAFRMDDEGNTPFSTFLPYFRHPAVNFASLHHLTPPF